MLAGTNAPSAMIYLISVPKELPFWTSDLNKSPTEM
jgi:hypothetical protein